jgi:glucokinase
MEQKMRSARAVVADIGGTNARFAVADLETLELSEIRHFLCSEHPTLACAASAYLQGLKESPCHAALAVAAPVVGEEISQADIAPTWALRQPDMMVIPKAATLEHVRENHAALDIRLTDRDLAELDRTFPSPRRRRPLELL